jgi:hypothetical protein
MKRAEVVPLVSSVPKGTYKDWDSKLSPGWTAADANTNMPEVEVFCGGLNDKAVEWAAIWRQGNLLHFGFDQTPEEMNETGRALLLNSIDYIARFTEERPIAYTPSREIVPRGRWALNGTWKSLDGVKEIFSPATMTMAREMGAEKFKVWCKENKPYIHADDKGQLALDEDVKALGAPFDKPEFFAKAIAGLRKGGAEAARSSRLLARYVATGPGANANADAWEKWWNESREYAFFSEPGKYQWYIDELAKKRGTPHLRGSARASK